MHYCYPSNSRRGFIKKAVGLASWGIASTLLADALPVESVLPLPIPKQKLSLEINGVAHDLMVDMRSTLLDLLREQLNMTGTKKGCGMGDCGACMVHVNGNRTNACLSLALYNEGNKVTTIEGLAKGEALHPMQEAFLKHDAFQCGYCTSGQIMSAVACLKEGTAKNRDQIKDYMKRNICRCGSYQNIVDAIVEVQKSGAKV
jgi:xanthine dehydrogenase YagT iron-sulfur-binding subunit